MQRPLRPSAPLWPAVLVLAVLSAAAPAASAQAIPQRYDPANVNSQLNNPAFQRRMVRAARSGTQTLADRPADNRALGPFDQVQSQALQQMQSTFSRMPQDQQVDARALQTLSQTPEGRLVLEQLAAEQRRAPAAYGAQGRGAQSEYDQLFQQAYPDGMQGPAPSVSSRNGYAPRSSVGGALGGALLQDITNAAIQRSLGPRVQVQGNTYYYEDRPRRRP